MHEQWRLRSALWTPRVRVGEADETPHRQSTVGAGCLFQERGARRLGTEGLSPREGLPAPPHLELHPPYLPPDPPPPHGLGGFPVSPLNCKSLHSYPKQAQCLYFSNGPNYTIIIPSIQGTRHSFPSRSYGSLASRTKARQGPFVTGFQGSVGCNTFLPRGSRTLGPRARDSGLPKAEHGPEWERLWNLLVVVGLWAT